MGLSEIVIRVLCIGSVVLYTASASLIANPQVQFAPGIIEKVLEQKDNATQSFQKVTVDDQFLFQNLNARVNALESLFKIIGAPLQPVTLTIDKDRPVRVSIGATDIIMGFKAALSKGQLEHALIKAWIRQVGSSEVLNNPLRAEVYSDLVIALYEGELFLQDPENRKVAKFTELQNWNNDLLGTVQLCESPWRPAELISYCIGAKRSSNEPQTSYSLRNVIGSLIWKDLSNVGLLERRAALAKLSRNIRSQPVTVEALELKSGEPNLGIDGLKLAIESEAKEIFPDLSSELPHVTPTVGLLKGKRLSMAGGFEINAIGSLQFKKMIVETCDSLSVDELLAKTSEATEHILLVQNCDDKQIGYSGFAQSGAARFAFDNRSVKFAYLHRASLKLADKMIANLDIQSALSVGSANSKNAKFLGLDQKIFREDVGAFKVNGPIGAIEWYRTEKPNARGSRS